MREKTNSTMNGTLYWEHKAWTACMYVDKYEAGQYETKSENTNEKDIGQIWLLVGKYKKIEVIMNTNRFIAHKSPLKIENALLHPRVKGPTCACNVNILTLQASTISGVDASTKEVYWLSGTSMSTVGE
jgi:hypothetical protein